MQRNRARRSLEEGPMVQIGCLVATMGLLIVAGYAFEFLWMLALRILYTGKAE